MEDVKIRLTSRMQHRLLEKKEKEERNDYPKGPEIFGNYFIRSHLLFILLAVDMIVLVAFGVHIVMRMAVPMAMRGFSITRNWVYHVLLVGERQKKGRISQLTHRIQL